MAQLLVETTDIKVATQVEQEAGPGTYEAKFYTTELQSQERLQQVFDECYYAGIDVKGVYPKKAGGLYYVGVIFRKPQPARGIAMLPVAVIPLIGFGILSALIGFGIFKIEEITSGIAKVLLILIGGTVIVVALAKKPLEAAASKYMAKG